MHVLQQSMRLEIVVPTQQRWGVHSHVGRIGERRKTQRLPVVWPRCRQLPESSHRVRSLLSTQQRARTQLPESRTRKLTAWPRWLLRCLPICSRRGLVNGPDDMNRQLLPISVTVSSAASEKPVTGLLGTAWFISTPNSTPSPVPPSWRHSRNGSTRCGGPTAAETGPRPNTEATVSDERMPLPSF